MIGKRRSSSSHSMRREKNASPRSSVCPLSLSHLCFLTRQGVVVIHRDSENTRLQLKLNDLAKVIVKIGSIAGVLLFVALFIRFIVQVVTNNPQGDPLFQFIFQ